MTGTGLRERKKAETRSALRETAVSLAHRDGPDAITVEQVCAAVGVSARTFFNYFASKDDALFGVDAGVLSAIVADVVARPAAEDPATALITVLHDLLSDAAGSSVWHDQLALIRDHPEVLPRLDDAQRALERACTEAVSLRTGRLDLDAHTTAAAVLAAQRVAVAAWREQPDGPGPDVLFERSAALVRSGLDLPTHPSS
ncbi:TetR/AcrR family transcriptional regulator [Actinomycetospora termitidis]|uniref:TetR/AcrR family transcriptional regulator n=1 Tax=Actinomycetospora termitidis TaxID=3053470 RepID=A0ABT7MH29_9PSEU|nr:TetR/AcrR family transcriptional regulator [Actinomycetospora sp. Odt1-22]MDL5159167.1 TetR/AcrR family transcriptional regulator [Actinomycetospora sp. Odt1-22]